MIANKDFYFLNHFRVLFLFCCLLILTSCGVSGCYQEPNSDSSGTYINKYVSFDVDSIVDEKKDNKISVKRNEELEIKVSGTVSMCKNKARNAVSKSYSNAIVCKDGKKKVCNATCTDAAKCFNCTGEPITTPSPSICAASENSICLDGTKYNMNDVNKPKKLYNCSDMVTCDEGKNQYWYHDATTTTTATRGQSWGTCSPPIPSASWVPDPVVSVCVPMNTGNNTPLLKILCSQEVTPSNFREKRYGNCYKVSYALESSCGDCIDNTAKEEESFCKVHSKCSTSASYNYARCNWCLQTAKKNTNHVCRNAAYFRGVAASDKCNSIIATDPYGACTQATYCSDGIKNLYAPIKGIFVGSNADICQTAGFCAGGKAFKQIGNGFGDAFNKGYETTSYGDCSDQGKSKLVCDEEGNETIYFYDKEGIPVNANATGRRCQKLGHIDSRKESWSEIMNDVYKGDVVSMSINKPIDGDPKALSKDRKFTYKTPGNTTINRWVDKNKYADLVTRFAGGECPDLIKYSDSIDTLKKTTQYKDCEALKKYTTPFWHTFGKKLFLKGINSGDCSAIIDNKDAVYFNSTDATPDFGITQQINDKDHNTIQVYRQFIATEQFSKICAKVDDTDYTDNLGGYNVATATKSCIAVNGNPSACCTAGGGRSLTDNRGALEYVFGKPDDPTNLWRAVSSAPKKASLTGDSSTDTFTIKNDATGGACMKNLYFRIASGSDRQDNSGYYTVEFTHKQYTASGSVGSVITSITDSVKDMVFGGSGLKKYFTHLAGNHDYIQYIRTLLVLSIILYGLAFLMGYVEFSQSDFIIRILKIGTVLILISPQGFDLFHDYFFKLFIEGTDDLIAKASIVGDFSTLTSGDQDSCLPSQGGNNFPYFDKALALLFFNPTTWLKILALLATSPMGIVLVILLITALFYFLIGVFNAIITYLMCFLAVGILIFIAPVIIPFMLFQTTYFIFENWWKLLARYALEPVLLVVGLQVLVELFFAALIKTLDFHVCWKCAWPINLGAIKGLDKALKTTGITTEVFCLSFFGPHGVYDSGGMLLGGVGLLLSEVILVAILAHTIKGYNGFIGSMLDTLLDINSDADLSPSGKIANFARKSLASGEKWVGDKVKSTARKGMSRATGLNLKTGEERKEERRSEKAQKAEIDKRDLSRSLAEEGGWLGRKLGRDLDVDTCNALMGNLSNSKLAEQAKLDGAKGIEGASQLGRTMFESLSKDLGGSTFLEGMSALRDKKGTEVDGNLKDLHRVLNNPAARLALNELTDHGKKNDQAVKNARERLGKLIFTDSKASEAFLGEGRENVSKEIFKLGREKRSGV